MESIRMKKDYTDITLVLDRSGSMQSIWSDVEGGLNSFIERNKQLPGTVKFTLVVFDSYYSPTNTEQTVLETVINAVDIRQLGKIDLSNYRPRGGTPLYDAMGITINNLGARLASLPESERPEKVLFVTYTDGQENASKEFSRGVKSMVEHQTQKYAWEFVYMGTNQDIHVVGASLGIPIGNRKFYACNSMGVMDSVQKMSAGSLKMRSANYKPGTYFDADDDNQVVDVKASSSNV